MEIIEMERRVHLLIAAGILIGTAVGIKSGLSTSNYMPAPSPIAWHSVGGCGASSGSAGSSQQLQWIGEGLIGTLLDVEIMGEYSMLANTAIDSSNEYDGRLKTTSATMRPSVFLRFPGTELMVTVPMISKQGYDLQTASIGDISITTTRKWGQTGSISTSLTLGFPTGEYDIHNTKDRYAVPEMQIGSGIFSASLSLAYDRGFDWGIAGGLVGYSGGLFAMKTKDFGYNTTIEMVSRDRTFQYARDGYAAVNDIGTSVPDNLNFSGIVGVRARSFFHGFQVSLGIPQADAAYTDHDKKVKRSFSRDTSAANYYPDRESAQQYADTVTDDLTEEPYEDPVVVGADASGQWVIIERKRIERQTNPSFSVQYSIEKSDAIGMPILLGSRMTFDLNEGVVFSGILVSAGIKFPVY